MLDLTVQLEETAVLNSFERGCMADVHDMAAMHPDETLGIEPGLKIRDGEVAKVAFVSVKDPCVVGIGLHRIDLLGRKQPGGAVARDGNPSTWLRRGLRRCGRG